MKPELQPQLLREIYRVAKIGTWEVDTNDKLIWSDETFDLFGVNRAAFNGKIEEFYDLVHPDDLENVKRVADFSSSRQTFFKSEYRIIRPDGKTRHMRQTAIVLRNSVGKPQGFSGVVQDVTQQVETEAQLRQAQKMEAVGQLSGGVAHDFNNILATIMSAAELMQIGKSYDPDLVVSIIKSARSGGELTRRLLAFARKQPLRKTLVEVTQLIHELAPMLDRIVGSDIELRLELSDQDCFVLTDPAPLQEALVNLTLNSRDAIEGKGTILLSCRNIASPDSLKLGKQCTELCVRDTGSGMSEQTLLHATAPFFTTKPVGKGSGLGLSMVEGFVRQSGGEIIIQSNLSEGTCISILLPKARKGKTESHLTPETPNNGHGESVLVLEDNADLASLLERQLTSLNYRPTLAQDRDEAFVKAKKANGFDIMLSDVLLGSGDRGPFVVKELSQLYPRMKPIFMTGFAPDSEEISNTIGAVDLVLRKPFNLKRLAKILRIATQTNP